jgi:N6-adenosine-specific RNA methylase IME4
MLFQRTQVQFPAPTWKFTVICNSSSRGSDTLTQTHTCKKNANAHKIKINPSFFKIFKKDLFISCMWVHYHCLQTHQKRALDPITDGCEPPCGCWELNSGPLGRAVSALNHWAISLAWKNFFFWRSNLRKEVGSQFEGSEQLSTVE